MKIEFRNPRRMPTVDEIKRQQVEESEREVLRHQPLLEQHAAGVAYHRVRLARLQGSVVPLSHPVAKGGVR